MHISGLYVYPLKGAAGIALDAAELDDFGIRHDRRWMVVDADGSFITARRQPRLARVRTEVDDDALVLHVPGSDPLRCGDAEGDGADAGEGRDAGGGAGRVRVRVWDDEVDAVDAGDAAAARLTAWLGIRARLVRMPRSTVRQVALEYARPGDRVGFADAFPLLIIGQASLDELNRRLDEPVPMLRFRPNVVVAGARPHEEDEWTRIRAGAVECDVVKGCARCVVTTLDPATGVAGREPLRTLGAYRKRDGHVWFGQNAIHRGRGTIRIGDAVDVLARVNFDAHADHASGRSVDMRHDVSDLP